MTIMVCLDYLIIEELVKHKLLKNLTSDKGHDHTECNAESPVAQASRVVCIVKK